MKRLAIVLIATVAVLGLLGGAGYYLTHHVDGVRVYYKRFKAENSYVFDEVSPYFKKTDPAKLIRIKSRESAAQIRDTLAKAIWGPKGLPKYAQPELVTGEVPDVLRTIPGVATARTWRIPVDLGYTAFIYMLHPQRSNGRLVIYQHGYAGTVEAMTPLIGELIASGYTVATSNYPEYGANRFPAQLLERFGWYNFSHDRIISVHPHPIRFYVEPVIALLNKIEKDHGFTGVDMIGFSAGGWIATLAAAVDTRIGHTLTVAGGYPLYLRLGNFERETPPPQLHQPLLMAANYLEMYALAAYGEKRALTQIFNRYDRCCYRNTLARLYEPAVRNVVTTLGKGGFRVLIDESHADHKVSNWAIARIIESLAAR